MSTAESIEDTRPSPEQGACGPFTLGVDIGGTNVKASVMDRQGGLVAEQVRMPTPKPATPKTVLKAIEGLAGRLPSFNRISVGFPGVVKSGTTITAPNLGTQHWAGIKLIDVLSRKFGVPVRVLNDAAVQGLGVVQGEGLECVLTLGTGVGCALFRDRRLLLPLEIGQHRVRKGKTYDQYIGQAALVAKGPEAWNRRVAKAIGYVSELTVCDMLYVGGGNARRITFALPKNVKTVSNTAGITGGVRLWESSLDDLFRDEPLAQERQT